MGIMFSTLWSRLFATDSNYKIIIVGLDNAGKTTILYKLSLGEVVTTQPTIGSNVEEVSYKNVKFTAWDLGGQANLRPSWNTYYADTNAVLVVIDASDRERIGTIREEIERLLQHEDLASASVCVYANKQDVRGAMSAEEVATALSLHSIKSHPWTIQACCALNGDGIYEGLDWVTEQAAAASGAAAH